MKSKNNVQLIGYLGQDPELLQVSNGSKRAKLRMATNDYFKNESGELRQITTWHDIIAWDGLAESVPGNFIKGSHILIDGKIVNRTFQDRTGHTRYVTEIKAYGLYNLDR